MLCYRGPRIPVGILHCTVLVAAAVAADHTLHSLAGVKVDPEEMDSLKSLGACLEISKGR